MNDALALPGFELRPEPGRGRAIALSFLVHLVLIAGLFLGVRWQSRAPSTVTVELWEPQPALPAAVPEVPKPEPVAAPPQEAKPEPRVEKPDIALKAAKAKAKPKAEKKARAPVTAKKAAPAESAQAPDEDYQRELREQLTREEARMAAERQSEELRQLGKQAEQQARLRSAALAKERIDYIARITGKVRGNWILPQQMEGNPEAVFLVIQLPTGEVLEAKLVKSSGLPAYDAAVERAILKSSPLPVPRSRENFSRELKLTFKPHD